MNITTNKPSYTKGENVIVTVTQIDWNDNSNIRIGIYNSSGLPLDYRTFYPADAANGEIHWTVPGDRFFQAGGKGPRCAAQAIASPTRDEAHDYFDHP